MTTQIDLAVKNPFNQKAIITNKVISLGERSDLFFFFSQISIFMQLFLPRVKAFGGKYRGKKKAAFTNKNPQRQKLHRF